MAENSKKKDKHDPFSGITGGLVLILLGVLFLLATLDYISWGNWWAYLLMGMGAILILDVVIRAKTLTLRHQGTGKLIAGAVLIVIGTAHIFGRITWWPLILIAIGIILLITSLRKAA